MALNPLKYRLNYCWRLVVTGICFLGFSVGSAVLSALVFPLVYCLARDPDIRHQWAQWFIHKGFAFMLLVLRAGGVMRLEIAGAERLRNARNVLVLANHPCLLDIVVLLSLMPRANCVVKTSFWTSPWVGGVVRTAGYIDNSTPEQLIESCADSLRIGAPLVIFPEGTRTCLHRPLKFRRGAAHIALISRKKMLPVLLQCDPPTLRKGSHWYHIPPRPFCIRVVVRAPISVQELADCGPNTPVTARRLTAALEDYFARELSAL